MNRMEMVTSMAVVAALSTDRFKERFNIGGANRTYRRIANKHHKHKRGKAK